jgi:hypothetical protein
VNHWHIVQNAMLGDRWSGDLKMNEKRIMKHGLNAPFVGRVYQNFATFIDNANKRVVRGI